jgi:hypothetical protein
VHPREVSSIGYDTGYELGLVFSGRPVAFENSPDSHQLAADLLGFFVIRLTVWIRSSSRWIRKPDWRERFGRVIRCKLLEHLHDPALAMRTMRVVLHREGLLS